MKVKAKCKAHTGEREEQNAKQIASFKKKYVGFVFASCLPVIHHCLAELMLTRLELGADDWGDTADGTQHEHKYTEQCDDSYEQQEHSTEHRT